MASRPRSSALWLLLVACVFAGFWFLDPLVYHALYLGDERKHAAEKEDWHKLLRVVGYLPTWVAVSLCFTLHDRWRGGRGIRILLAAILSGAAAELLLRLVGRVRPVATDGRIAFKPLFHAFVDDSNLSFPSSHAAVAFGGAFMLAMLVPRISPIVVGLAIGCGITRLLAGAHALTDVFAAGVIGYVIARLLRPRQDAGRIAARASLRR